MQRTVPKLGVKVSVPAVCSDEKTAKASSIPNVAITYNDNDTVFYVHAGGPVSVTYPFGRPVFSPGNLLCADVARGSLGHAYYVAADSGSGFVYIPEPTGTIVAEIDVTPSQSVPVLLVVLALAIFALDIVLTISMKRSMRARSS